MTKAYPKVAIATPPDQPTKYREMTEAEKEDYDNRQKEWDEGAEDRAKEAIRIKREPLILAASKLLDQYRNQSFVANPNKPITEDQAKEVAEYLESLRNLTNAEDLNNITWPEEPEILKNE